MSVGRSHLLPALTKDSRYALENQSLRPPSRKRALTLRRRYEAGAASET